MSVARAEARMLTMLLKIRIVVSTRPGWLSQRLSWVTALCSVSSRCLALSDPKEVIAVSDAEKHAERMRQTKMIAIWVRSVWVRYSISVGVRRRLERRDARGPKGQAFAGAEPLHQVSLLFEHARFVLRRLVIVTTKVQDAVHEEKANLAVELLTDRTGVACGVLERDH